jgi:hypothetical protein
MRSLDATWLLLGIAWCCWGEARAQLRVVPGLEPQQVFAGEARQISVVWQNCADKRAIVGLRAKVSQASSATVMPISETPWKQIEVLPGQTILESATFDFPPVKAETRFLVQWVEGTSNVVGVTEVLVYPVDLLKELKPLAGDEPLGVFDPQNQMKPLIKAVSIGFVDLENVNLENFGGRLAIFGPFSSKTQMREGFTGQIKTLAGKGAGVVWIQPPPDPRDEMKPSFYTVYEGKGAVVVAQAGLVSNLADNPQAQINLIHLARIALNSQSFSLPNLAREP